jgi:hypothetical protein
LIRYGIVKLVNGKAHRLRIMSDGDRLLTGYRVDTRGDDAPLDKAADRTLHVIDKTLIASVTPLYMSRTFALLTRDATGETIT